MLRGGWGPYQPGYLAVLSSPTLHSLRENFPKYLCHVVWCGVVLFDNINEYLSSDIFLYNDDKY